ncbi:hypothetical protein FRB99_003114 [Tulasnella sp. 403]|nr:hypothetical protein FRB99_003114 [Tulasnella sp. 403]
MTDRSSPTHPRRPNNDSFRPALRFPTDPHNPGSLPSKIKHIVAPQSSSASATSSLLQSRRKPWEVDTARLDELMRRERGRKVVLVLGDPPLASLEPIISSNYLRGSLVLIVASKGVPSHVLASHQANNAISGTGTSPRSAHVGPPASDQFTASRLNTVLEWAERVANGWRADPQNQSAFALLYEGEGPGDGISPKPTKGGWKRKVKSKPAVGTSTGGSTDANTDGNLMPWTARFMIGSRSDASSLATGSSDSLYVVDSPTSDDSQGSMSSATGRKVLRPSASALNLSTTANVLTPKHATSVLGHGSSFSHATTAPDRTVPPQKRRFSLTSFTRRKSSTPPPASTSWPSFDALFNFLPPSSATGLEGQLGRGAIATSHVMAAHNKLLLRQTILVTTAARKFLVPLVAKSGKQNRERGRFGGLERGLSSGRALSTDTWRSTSTAKRLSLSLTNLFGGISGSNASAKGKGLPTPPISRPSSSEEGGNQPPIPRVSSSSSNYPASIHPCLPKLIHVLPFTATVMPTVTSGLGGAGSSLMSINNTGNAKLIRNLEAFLLSWSFGGSANGEAGVGAEDIVVDGPPGKRTVRPFLLDLSGLADSLQCSALAAGDKTPDGMYREYPLMDLILAGAMDDEYPVSGHLAAPQYSGTDPASSSDSSSVPSLTVTRASTDQGPSSRPSTCPPVSILNGFEKGDVGSWATRRAWLGGAGDLVVFPQSTVAGSSRARSDPSVGAKFVVDPTRRRYQSFGEGGHNSGMKTSGSPASASTSLSGSSASGASSPLSTSSMSAALSGVVKHERSQPSPLAHQEPQARQEVLPPAKDKTTRHYTERGGRMKIVVPPGETYPDVGRGKPPISQPQPLSPTSRSASGSKAPISQPYSDLGGRTKPTISPPQPLPRAPQLHPGLGGSDTPIAEQFMGRNGANPMPIPPKASYTDGERLDLSRSGPSAMPPTSWHHHPPVPMDLDPPQASPNTGVVTKTKTHRRNASSTSMRKLSSSRDEPVSVPPSAFTNAGVQRSRSSGGASTKYGQRDRMEIDEDRPPVPDHERPERPARPTRPQPTRSNSTGSVATPTAGGLSSSSSSSSSSFIGGTAPSKSSRSLATSSSSSKSNATAVPPPLPIPLPSQSQLVLSRVPSRGTTAPAPSGSLRNPLTFVGTRFSSRENTKHVPMEIDSVGRRSEETSYGREAGRPAPFLPYVPAPAAEDLLRSPVRVAQEHLAKHSVVVHRSTSTADRRKRSEGGHVPMDRSVSETGHAKSRHVDGVKHSHSSRPSMDGVTDKRLPTPPDSASSSDMSNESGLGRDGRNGRWWTSPKQAMLRSR